MEANTRRSEDAPVYVSVCCAGFMCGPCFGIRGGQELRRPAAVLHREGVHSGGSPAD